MTEFVVLSLEYVEKHFPIDPKTGSRERETSPGHAICPIALESGLEFILPLEAIADEKHAAALDALKLDAARPIDLKSAHLRREVTAAEFKRDVETKDEAGDPKSQELKP